jgi:poly-gamma-glutamate synthesis protein (capsule biosynthesis protein)
VTRVARIAGGALAFLALHCGFLMMYNPRSAAADHAAPRRIARAPLLLGETTVLFAGDTAEAEFAMPVLLAEGFRYPFSRTDDLVRSADLAVVNAEAPITDSTRVFPIYKQWTYRAPAESMDALAWAGFDVLSLANNHAVDCLDEGVADTIANAERRGLAVVGAGRDAVEARRGVIATVGDVRIGLLAYLENQFLFRIWVDAFARSGHAGAAAATEEALAADIARLRPEVDLLVVSFHAGYNYAPPTASTLRWSRRAVELGADLVVNHHPHVAHPVMMVRGHPVLLSIGNYALGTEGKKWLDYGYLALAHLAGRHLDRVELVPIAVQNRRVHFRPEPLVGDELERALARLRAESAPLGAEVHIERGRGVVYVGGRS